MDVASCLQVFESSFSSYTGDDPLDVWLKFVEYLDQSLPEAGSSEMSVVLDRLLQNFLSVERYANDARFVNACIRCAAYYPEPINLFHHIFSQGVGTTTAALYVAWARCFERKAMTEEADAVYRQAVENRARPAESLMREYRQFRARSRSREKVSGGVAEPSSGAARTAAPAQAAAELQASGGVLSGHTVWRDERPLEVMYSKDALASEGSELCFEEARARTYLRKRRLKWEAEERLRLERVVREDEEAVARLRRQLHDMGRALKMSATGSPSGRPTRQEGCGGSSARGDLNASQARALDAPDNSPSCPHAAPSHVPPSPTVNTREALDVIMGMFQAPPLTEASLDDTSASVPGGSPSDDANGSDPTGGSAAAAAAEPFTVYQDDASASTCRTLSKSRATRGRGLSDNWMPLTYGGASRRSADTSRDGRQEAAAEDGWSQRDKAGDEMGAWAEGWPATCPNNTADFALAARCVSTPFARKGLGEASQGAADVTCARREADDNTFIGRSHKLSPIMEQSPPDDKSSAGQPASSFAAHAGTILGEGLAAHRPSSRSAAAATFSFVDRTTLGPSASVGENARDAVASVRASPEKECRHLSDGAASASRPARLPCGPRGADLDADFPSAVGPTPLAERNVAGGAQADRSLCASQESALNPFRVFANNSPSRPHAAASRPPSPTVTVNTREALDVIMGMFQAPPLTEASLDDTSALVTGGSPSDDANGSDPTGSAAAAAEPFTVYQDDASASACRTLSESRAARGRGLSDNWMPLTYGGAARDGRQEEAAAAEDGWSQRDKAGEEMGAWAEGWPATCPNNTADFALAARCVSTPFARKGLGDASQGAVDVTCAGGEADDEPFVRHLHKLSPIVEQSPPEPQPSASAAAQSTALDGTVVGERLSARSAPPPPPALFCEDRMEMGTRVAARPADVPVDRRRRSLPSAGERAASPKKERGGLSDAGRPPSDPWSDRLISHLLSRMSPPLTSHPQCVSWRRSLPDIGAKKTISMGKASLRVDRVLGQGAFATVYQATDPDSCDKVVLKVQKPANIWEFYIHTQLDRRLPPSVRHLFGRIRSAHVFTDGSVLLGEAHGYGTLLNAANLYKGVGDKVMPQPLVIYFTVCILRMLEELHAARLIHADVKPDNFMLGERFVENDDFEADELRHGLVLIDLGQSIDMDLFPPGTAFTARCLTSGFQCTEMLSGKPWNYQTDLFGAAGTVHVLLFGTYMQVVQEDGEWRTRATFRRMPHGDMWLHLFRTLLNVPGCRPALADLADLRRRLSAVLRSDYRHKMASLKSRLLVLLLESRKAAWRQ
ncbi:mitotic checkpoint serine/threonine-protein kinase BUB1 isoform X2 [Hippocampus zosterae]|uniref:mitotic checkpoint serine/threonine-protein kinase BUB1 isoform X2 n=1 Tax=Hippocampus zosterae TaxID=109293 RepID=UPI00223E7739|nr:mitotic checkpoint serine/threonine-protein kinase BUB1 isoform X2 [Hippocampus zosterae]